MTAEVWAWPMNVPALRDMFPILGYLGLELPVLVAAGNKLTSTLPADTLGTIGSRPLTKHEGHQPLHDEDRMYRGVDWIAFGPLYSTMKRPSLEHSGLALP